MTTILHKDELDIDLTVGDGWQGVSCQIVIDLDEQADRFGCSLPFDRLDMEEHEMKASFDKHGNLLVELFYYTPVPKE